MKLETRIDGLDATRDAGVGTGERLRVGETFLGGVSAPATGERSAPDASVLIVTYNARTFVGSCLRALAAAVAPRTFETIVVDNDSRDGTVETLRAEFPEVIAIPMGRNAGFARAVNLSIGRARGRHLLLLNPDAVPMPGAIALLVDFLDARPDVGAVGPRLLDPDLTDQGTGRAFPTAAAAIFGRRSVLTRAFPTNPWSRRYLVSRERAGDVPFAVDWVSGACLMVRRDVVATVGGLDEGFFMFWEDADWCRRMKAAGHGVHCVPASRVIHSEGSSRKGWSARHVWTFHRSVYRYYAKHHAPVAWDPRRPLAAVILAARALAIIGLAALGSATLALAGRTPKRRGADL